MNMASFFFKGFCFSAILAAVATAEEFKVGAADGWKQPSPNQSDQMYSRWAQPIKFHVGDSLRFEYKNDTVMVVDKYGYYHCNSTRPASVFKDGNTVINLERPGPAYFVSGDPDHCKNGQRLMVEVITTLHAPSPNSAGAKSFFLVPHLLYLDYAAIIILLLSTVLIN